MGIWVLRAIVQGGLSLLPGNESCNYAFQKHVTNSLDLGPAAVRYKLAEARKHLASYFRLQNKTTNECNVLELGTGWNPIIPVLFHLCGVGRIWTIDKTAWLRAEDVRKALNAILRHARDGQLSKALPWIVGSRLATLEKVLQTDASASVIDLISKLIIDYLVLDACYTNLTYGSVDFLFP